MTTFLNQLIYRTMRSFAQDDIVVPNVANLNKVKVGEMRNLLISNSSGSHKKKNKQLGNKNPQEHNKRIYCSISYSRGF